MRVEKFFRGGTNGRSLFEEFLFSGAGYGFGFLQYIWEKENIFWDEVCYDPIEHPNCTVGKLPERTLSDYVGYVTYPIVTYM